MYTKKWASRHVWQPLHWHWTLNAEHNTVPSLRNSAIRHGGLKIVYLSDTVLAERERKAHLDSIRHVVRVSRMAQPEKWGRTGWGEENEEEELTGPFHSWQNETELQQAHAWD